MITLLIYAFVVLVGLFALACAVLFIREGLPRLLAYCNILQGADAGPKWLHLLAAIAVVGLGVAITMGLIRLIGKLLSFL